MNAIYRPTVVTGQDTTNYNITLANTTLLYLVGFKNDLPISRILSTISLGESIKQQPGNNLEL